MKVLFLTRYPVEGASSRYRVFQYLPALRAADVICDVHPFFDEKLYALSHEQGSHLEKAYRTLGRSLARLSHVLGFKKYDIIYMQRELFPFAGPVMENLLRSFGAKLIFDYDDALFIKKPSKYNNIATAMRAEGKTQKIVKLVDLVIAGNDYLRDCARALNTPAVTLHVAEDATRVPPKHQDTGPLVVGWLGSPSTEKYLDLIREPLTHFFKKHGSRAAMQIMGGGDFKAEFPITHLKWSLEGEKHALQNFDLGLMPLPLEDWSLGKSGGKARTYMAAGVVPVCQAIGYNMELIENGRTGFLVTHSDEWFETLSVLAADPELRAVVSRNARRYVSEHFSVEKQAAALRGLLQDVVDGNLEQYRNDAAVEQTPPK